MTQLTLESLQKALKDTDTNIAFLEAKKQKIKGAIELLNDQTGTMKSLNIPTSFDVNISLPIKSLEYLNQTRDAKADARMRLLKKTIELHGYEIDALKFADQLISLGDSIKARSFLVFASKKANEYGLKQTGKKHFSLS